MSKHPAKNAIEKAFKIGLHDQALICTYINKLFFLLTTSEELICLADMVSFNEVY